ncbi:MAG: TIGR03118 family protein [Solirubrobacterales bacterium]|nr:TIGR03118 family protein [Solirubrobacterales bacterium]MBV9916805.1 TIGR03118 family protein [Solirubrobacterales bacterium]
MGAARGRTGPFVRRRKALSAGVVAAIAAVAIPVAASAGASPGQYQQTNLISDIPGVARITDANLVNPWGQAAGPATPLWVADNGKDVSTLYSGGVNGSIPAIVPLVVSIPGGAPTGVVWNATDGFKITTDKGTAPANFIFDSEAGKITAWSRVVSGTTAQVEHSRKQAVYKGLAIASAGGATYLYAANFHSGRIEVYNSRFKRVRLSGHFRDAQIPAGFAPFDVQELAGKLYVTYAKQNAQRHDDVAGPGNGFVDVFDTSGHLLTRLVAHGDLNSPWGLALAPASFGAFAGELLVGNFGDGKIHAYDPMTGAAKGELVNTDNNPIQINGLWALRFGNGVFGAADTLVFTAGIGDESHGLLGEISPAK